MSFRGNSRELCKAKNCSPVIRMKDQMAETVAPGFWLRKAIFGGWRRELWDEKCAASFRSLRKKKEKRSYNNLLDSYMSSLAYEEH